MSTAAAARFAVIYRTGGTANFRWRLVLDTYATRAEAQEVADATERMGYPALVHDAARLKAVGLPETFAPSEV